MQTALRQHLFTVFKLVFAGGLIYWLVSQKLLDLDQFRVLFQWHTLVPCFALGLGLVLMNHFRWKVLMDAQGFKRPYSATLPFTFIGLFFNYAMPSSVGGDVVKGYYISREFPGKKLDVALTVLIDRVIGLYVMFMLAVLALVYRYDLVAASEDLKQLFILLIFIFAGLNIGVIAVMNTTVRRLTRLNLIIEKIDFVKRVDIALRAYWSHKQSLLIALASSVLSQTSAILFFIVVANALGESLDTSAFFFAVPLGFVLMAVPLAPAGIGVGQVAYLFLFQVVAGATAEPLQVGPVGISALQAIHFVCSLPGAYYYLRNKKLRLSKGEVVQ